MARGGAGRADPLAACALYRPQLVPDGARRARRHAAPGSRTEPRPGAARARHQRRQVWRALGAGGTDRDQLDLAAAARAAGGGDLVDRDRRTQGRRTGAPRVRQPGGGAEPGAGAGRGRKPDLRHGRRALPYHRPARATVAAAAERSLTGNFHIRCTLAWLTAFFVVGVFGPHRHTGGVSSDYCAITGIARDEGERWRPTMYPLAGIAGGLLATLGIVSLAVSDPISFSSIAERVQPVANTAGQV